MIFAKLPYRRGGLLNLAARDLAQRGRDARVWPKRFPGYPRCMYYGAITWRDLFLATSVFRGTPYRRGLATRRQKWGF